MFRINILYVLIIFFLINIISLKTNIYIDLSKNKTNTLSKTSKKILDVIDDDMYFKVFLQGNLNNHFSEMSHQTERILENINRYNNNIKFQFINPNSEKTSLSELENNKLKIIEVQKVKKKKNNKGLKKTSYSKQIAVPGCIIYYKNKTKTVNFIEDVEINKYTIAESIKNLEYEILESIKKLSKNKKENIAILTGHNDFIEKQTSFFKKSIEEKYNIEYFNIKEFTDPNSIDKQIKRLEYYKTIIIAKPIKSFTDLDKFIIDQYIMRGGKTIWMIDGTNDGGLNQSNERLTKYKESNLKLDKMLSQYGIVLNKDLILDSICDIIHIGENGENKIKWPYFPILTPKKTSTLGQYKGFIKTKFISSIDTIKSKNKKTIILKTSNSSYRVKAPNYFFTNDYKFQKKPISCGVLIEGKINSAFKDYSKTEKSEKFEKINEIKNNKIIVISDGDIIINNYEIDPKSGKVISNINYGNQDFIENCIEYMCDDLNLIDLKNKILKINYINNEKIVNKRKIQLTATIIPIIIIIFIGYMINILRLKRNEK